MSLPKPCPFCGSGNIGIDFYFNEEWHFSYCRDCGANGPEQPTEVLAALAWNRRAGDEADNISKE